MNTTPVYLVMGKMCVLSLLLHSAVAPVFAHRFESKKNTIVFTKIAACYEHTVTIKGGVVYAWGNNQFGQLGVGNVENQSGPVLVNTLKQVISVANGSSASHSLALTAAGEVWAWGKNYDGQLGIGSHITWTVPQLVPNLVNIRAIAVGDMHSLALDSEGDVWSWGKNYDDQLGIPVKLISSIPLKIKGLQKIEQISAGRYHSLALRSDGTVWVWGKNPNGQLGIDDVGGLKEPTMVKGLPRMVQISAGDSHSAGLSETGEVWMWGSNEYGQVGLGMVSQQATPIKIAIADVVAIALGGMHSLALKADGTVWGWGCNVFGQLGIEGKDNRIIPVQVPDLENITEISAGDLHAAALKKDGTVITWGINSKGQIGIEGNDKIYKPVAVMQIDFDPSVATDATFESKEPATLTVHTAREHSSFTLQPSAESSEESNSSSESTNSSLSFASVPPEYKVPPSHFMDTIEGKAFHIIPPDEATTLPAEECPIAQQLKNIHLKLICNNRAAAPAPSVSLKWSVRVDASNIDFHIARSKNGVDWELIEPVQFMSEQGGMFVFETTDHENNGKYLYYRLQQMNCNGETSYAQPVLSNCH